MVAITGPDTGTVRLPITQSQAGLLVIDRMIATRHIYNCVAEVDLAPGFTEAPVRAALATAVALQPALREVFVDLPSPHAVRVPPPTPDEIPMTTTDGCDDALVDAAVDRLGRTHFDPQRGPLYEAAYLVSPDRATLVLAVHHLVFDGFSLRPLLRELDTALAAPADAARVEQLRAAREAAFDRELAVHERVGADEATDRTARAWAEELRDLSTGPLYPRPHRPVRTDFVGARRAFTLDAAEAAAVAATCARLDITPFVFFTAAYGVVLARHTASRTAVVGSPLLARHTAGAFDLAGFFVNTLPIVLDVDWNTTFDAYAAHVRTAIGRTRSRIDVAFNQLVTHVRPDRSTDRNPVFAAMLAMQDTPPGEPGAPVRGARERGNGTAKFDLWLGVTPQPTGWLLECEYDRQLLPDPVADDLIASLRTAIDRALRAEPATRLTDLCAEGSLTASTRTDGHWHEPPDADLDGWIRRACATWPDRVAVAESDAGLTYRELDATVTHASAGLRGHGVRPGNVVGIHCDRLTDTVVAMLAILRCGAAYLPLDPNLPGSRLEYMLRQADCRLIVGTTGIAAVPAVDMTTLLRAGLAPPPDAPPPDAPTPAGDRTHGAGTVYVMFSSGSTGAPKGIQMGTGPLRNLTAWQIAALDMGASTRFMQYAPLGFDVSFQEIVPTLAAGGTVVSREPVDRRDFPALVARLAAERVTHVYLPVAALRPLVQAALADRVTLPDLTHLCVSGEQLSVDAETRRFFTAHPHCVLVNLYGPTETHAVTTHRLSAADAEWPTHVPIGVPLTGVAAYVVDATGHLAPTGVVGDLHLGGACPADGYVNQPEMTAERFVTDRFAGSGTMYRTGDQTLRDEHGVLVFLGRADDQVKIRGYRIELGEIETAATGCPGVRQAVAVVRGTGDARDIVLFVKRDDDTPRADLDAHLRARLPGYMVPARVFDTATFPTTKNGKNDRAALLRIAEERVAADSAAAPAATPEYHDALEAELAGMWTRLIEVPNLSREQSLLESGANSLTVFTALAQVRREYGAAVPIIEFFRTPTIAALAAAIQRQRGGGLP
jgi:amino acid adenylation domain-containing protein